MSRRRGEGHYVLGYVDPSSSRRPRRCGEYGVIRGDIAEQNDHVEWSHICNGALQPSKWFSYRIGPDDNGAGTRTDLLTACETKQEAIEYLRQHHESAFDKEY
jgi:hypothetical protein